MCTFPGGYIKVTTSSICGAKRSVGYPIPCIALASRGTCVLIFNEARVDRESLLGPQSAGRICCSLTTRHLLLFGGQVWRWPPVHLEPSWWCVCLQPPPPPPLLGPSQRPASRSFNFTAVKPFWTGMVLMRWKLLLLLVDFASWVHCRWIALFSFRSARIASRWVKVSVPKHFSSGNCL